VLAAGLVHLLQAEMRIVTQSLARSAMLGAGVALLGGALGVYVFATTPLAARNIALQQHETHRFVAECWRKPVAVNDLGWVSFRNDAYVLDLWGLGSEEARKARAGNAPGWVGRLVTEHGVEAAILYPDWFPGLPPEWVRLGVIGYTERSVTPYAPAATVFATRPEAAEALRTCLRQLSDSGPAGLFVQILD